LFENAGSVKLAGCAFVVTAPPAFLNPVGHEGQRCPKETKKAFLLLLGNGLRLSSLAALVVLLHLHSAAVHFRSVSGHHPQCGGRLLIDIDPCMLTITPAPACPSQLYAFGLFLGTIYSVPPMRLKRFAVPAFMIIATVRGFLLNFGVFHATRAALGLSCEWNPAIL
jgi:hypothetical protein